MAILCWVCTVFAIIGAILNAKRKKACFIIWINTNLFLVVHNVMIQEYAQASLWGVYVGIAIYGLINWSKDEKRIQGP